MSVTGFRYQITLSVIQFRKSFFFKVYDTNSLLSKTFIESVGFFNMARCSGKYGELRNEPVHEIANNVVCATSKASDQPAHMRSLIRAFACRLNIL